MPDSSVRTSASGGIPTRVWPIFILPWVLSVDSNPCLPSSPVLTLYPFPPSPPFIPFSQAPSRPGPVRLDLTVAPPYPVNFPHPLPYSVNFPTLQPLFAGTFKTRARVITAGAIIATVADLLMLLAIGWHDEKTSYEERTGRFLGRAVIGSSFLQPKLRPVIMGGTMRNRSMRNALIGVILGQ